MTAIIKLSVLVLFFLYYIKTDLNEWFSMAMCLVGNTIYVNLDIQLQYPTISLKHRLEIILVCFMHAAIVCFLLGVIHEYRNPPIEFQLFESPPTIWNQVRLLLLLSLIFDFIWNWRRRPKILARYPRKKLIRKKK